MFEDIPDEMKLFRQFVCWRFEDTSAPKPTKVPYSPHSGKHASVKDPETWGSFDECVNRIRTESTSSWYDGIGFVLTKEDPYAFIDLDDTKGDAKKVETQTKIFESFNSFSEKSPSGAGLHIIVKGSVEGGRKRSGVEVYCNERYMTMTGNVYQNLPINDCNEMLNGLHDQLSVGRNNSTIFYEGLAEPTDTDNDVIAMALNAANGDKFKRLWDGDWSGYNPNEKNDHSSEADFALVDIIAYYSHNKEQITRIFRASGLGQRPKAQRDDYVKYMLNRCFDNLLPPVDIDGLQNQLNAAIEARQKREADAAKNLYIQVPDVVAPTQEINMPKPANDVYSIPPGLLGEIAQFIYAQAPRPVAEIALAGALGLMSGIVGRSYNVSKTGLNHYVFLLAKSGDGKEAMSRGISSLFRHAVETVPPAMEFSGPAEISSPQAIVKYMSNGPKSFLSQSAEFGLYLEQMGSRNAAPHLAGIMRFLLLAYNKSGNGDFYAPSISADSQKSTTGIESPAMSVLGDSTPERFYNALNEDLITNGLVSRCTIVEYLGDRPPSNKNFAFVKPSNELIEKFASLCANSLKLNSQNKAIDVQFTPDAQAVFDRLDVKCDAKINAASMEVVRNIWTRVHVKAMKLSALIAVGCNAYDPTIDSTSATWAINFVMSDVNNLLKRFNAGEIGIDNDETKQLAAVIKVIKKFVVSAWSEVETYCADGQSSLHSNKIVPYSFIQRNLTSLAVFRKDRRGAKDALKRALDTLVERGDIEQISKATLKKEYGTACGAYMISHPKVFDL